MFLDNDLIRRLVKEPWRQRKHYQWRQLRGNAWCVGQRDDDDGTWWVAHSKRVTQRKSFAPASFSAEQEAKLAAVIAALLTAKR